MSKVLGISKKPVLSPAEGPRANHRLRDTLTDVCLGPGDPSLPMHETDLKVYKAERRDKGIYLIYPDGSELLIVEDTDIENLSIAINNTPEIFGVLFEDGSGFLWEYGDGALFV